jgi:hypothetical protein
MKTYIDFIKSNVIEEESIAFSYKDGGDEQTVLISGSSSQIKKVRNRLPSNTKFIDNAPEGSMEISASEWLKIQ